MEQVAVHFAFNCMKAFRNVWCISDWLFHQLVYAIIFTNGQKSRAVYLSLST